MQQEISVRVLRLSQSLYGRLVSSARLAVLEFHLQTTPEINVSASGGAPLCRVFHERLGLFLINLARLRTSNFLSFPGEEATSGKKKGRGAGTGPATRPGKIKESD